MIVRGNSRFCRSQEIAESRLSATSSQNCGFFGWKSRERASSGHSLRFLPRRPS